MALGAMGLRLCDFEALTPDEFARVWQRWRAREEGAERARWERTRMECCCILQPYAKGALTPRDIMRFPWDADDDGSADTDCAEGLTREEIMARYRAAKAAARLA